MVFLKFTLYLMHPFDILSRNSRPSVFRGFLLYYYSFWNVISFLAVISFIFFLSGLKVLLSSLSPFPTTLGFLLPCNLYLLHQRLFSNLFSLDSQRDMVMLLFERNRILAREDSSLKYDPGRSCLATHTGSCNVIEGTPKRQFPHYTGKQADRCMCRKSSGPGAAEIVQ